MKWNQYGDCPTCKAKIGEPCKDMRKALNRFTLTRPAIKRAHGNRSLRLYFAAGGK